MLADERCGDGEPIDVELGRVDVEDALGGWVVHDPAVGGGGVADKAAFGGPIFERADLAFIVGEVGIHVATEGAQDGEIRCALLGEFEWARAALSGGDVVAAEKSRAEGIPPLPPPTPPPPPAAVCLLCEVISKGMGFLREQTGFSLRSHSVKGITS